MMGASMGTALAGPYGDGWTRSSGWPGEWPAGFTLEKDLVTMVRAADDPGSSRDITCTLKKGATYHLWNAVRVKASNLEFVTYTPIVAYQVEKPDTFTLFNIAEQREEQVALAVGTEWKFLEYYGEGWFRMALNGVEYETDNTLNEASKALVKGAKDDRKSALWMKLTCDNGNTGWLLFDDIANTEGFTQPNLPDYGKALDVNVR